MAKARKRTTTAASEPPQSTWDDWMPLEAASAHIQQVVGGEHLAAEDLRLRFLSGDVEAQRRRVTPGEGIEIISLTPETFKGLDTLSDDLGPVLRSSPFHGDNIFLRRTDVYRIWPTAGADWMPPSAALLHIQQVVGGHELATEDLRLRIVSGDVEAQDRRVTPGEGMEVMPLTLEAFKAPSDDLGPLFRSRPFQGHNIFLRRSDVYRVWPIRLAEPASPPDEQPPKQLPTKRPKGIGPRAWLVAREVDALMREGGKNSKWNRPRRSAQNDSRADRRKGQGSAELADSGHGSRLFAQTWSHRPLTGSCRATGQTCANLRALARVPRIVCEGYAEP